MLTKFKKSFVFCVPAALFFILGFGEAWLEDKESTSVAADLWGQSAETNKPIYDEVPADKEGKVETVYNDMYQFSSFKTKIYCTYVSQICHMHDCSPSFLKYKYTSIQNTTGGQNMYSRTYQ